MDDDARSAERRSLFGRADQTHGAIVQYLDVHDDKQPGAEAPNHATDVANSLDTNRARVSGGPRDVRGTSLNRAGTVGSCDIAAAFRPTITCMHAEPLRLVTTSRARSCPVSDNSAGDTETAAASGAIARIATASRPAVLCSVVLCRMYAGAILPSCLLAEGWPGRRLVGFP